MPAKYLKEIREKSCILNCTNYTYCNRSQEQKYYINHCISEDSNKVNFKIKSIKWYRATVFKHIALESKIRNTLEN